MKILLLNEYFNPVLQNLIYYFVSILGPHNFNWTGKRWYRQDFLPMEDLEEASLIPEPQALTNLQNGFYDFAIFSDSSTYIFLSSQLVKTKRVIIDSIDLPIIPRLYWENSEIYFKCQLKDKVQIANKNEISEPVNISQLSKLYKLCLTPSFKVKQCNAYNYEENNKAYDIFFNGSAWPLDRIKIINKIKENPQINFFGGLFNRSDLPFNNVVSDSLRFKKMSSSDHLRAMKLSKINLNMKGNGDNCFRQFEVLYLSEFLLTQKTETYFGHVSPEDKKHCVYFDESNLIELIEYYLNHGDERKLIAQEGKKFYEEFYHPFKISQYILDILNLSQG